MISVLLAVTAASGAAEASCETPTTNEEVVVAIEKATAAYESLDVDGFSEAAVELESATACLGESITRGNAAEFHRIRGLAAFLEQKEVLCQKRFAAARAIEPEYTFPVTLVPEGNPVLDQYTAIDPTEGARQTLPYPAEGSVRLDGSTRLERQGDLPVVFQRIDARGVVVQTVILDGADPVPEYPSRKKPPPEPGKKKTPKGLRTALAVAGGGLVVASGGLLAAGASTRGKWDQIVESDNPNLGDAERVYRNNHALLISSVGLGVVGVGLGTTSFVLSGQF